MAEAATQGGQAIRQIGREHIGIAVKQSLQLIRRHKAIRAGRWDGAISRFGGSRWDGAISSGRWDEAISRCSRIRWGEAISSGRWGEAIARCGGTAWGEAIPAG